MTARTSPLRWWRTGEKTRRWLGHDGPAVVAELVDMGGPWTWLVDAAGVCTSGTAETLDGARERADAEWRARGGTA